MLLAHASNEENWPSIRVLFSRAAAIVHRFPLRLDTVDCARIRKCPIFAGPEAFLWGNELQGIYHTSTRDRAEERKG